jgi:hypothetical protein
MEEHCPEHTLCYDFEPKSIPLFLQLESMFFHEVRSLNIDNPNRFPSLDI